MKNTITILLVCFFGQSIIAQNYYVAFIKGEVYYQNKRLKKRNKIQIKGQLRFSSIDDYIKVSGPGGLYEIRPFIDNKISDNEFLVAVGNDLFPEIRYKSTTANNAVFDPSHYFGFYGNSYTFFEKTNFTIGKEWIENGSQLVLLHQMKEGLISQPAKIKKGELVIRKTDFILEKANTAAYIKSTAIVEVRDMERWLQLIEGKQTIDEILPFVDIYGDDFFLDDQSHIASAIMIDSLGNEELIEPEFGDQLPNTAQILDYLGPLRFISERKFTKDMRFFINSCQPTSEDEFLNIFNFEEYIEQNYGNLYWRSQSHVLNEKIAYWETEKSDGVIFLDED